MLSFYNSKNLIISITIFCVFAISCKKSIVVETPQVSVNEENVYKTDATAIAVLTAVYSKMVNEGLFTGRAGISLLPGLSADELSLAGVVTDNRLIAYYRNQLRTSPNESFGTELWEGTFYYIFICNAAIEGLNNSGSLSSYVKKQLLGEAKFMRAFFYFYLASFYSDVPLVLTTNPAINAALPRSPVKQVYQQVIADLKDAKDLLSENYLNKDLQNYTGVPERVRPTKWAASALLARTYLYMTDYTNAEVEANRVITNTALFSLPTVINSVFLKNSSEAIWQLQPVQNGRNTEDAFTFILPPTGPNVSVNPVSLSPQLLNSFELGDLRRKGKNWIDSVIVSGNIYYFPSKYKATISAGATSEYLMVFRLAEQLLIRAEARVQLNKLGEAEDDLNMIRRRAGLQNTSANDKVTLLAAILKERQVELFVEWGHRWLDLKRSGNLDFIMGVVTPLKANGGKWQSYQAYYPIYYNDILMDPNLSQNSGYAVP
ncbi:hypothetical protein A4D02_13740 [Niastella koreensis]|uniref:RagB/SusD domain-containing protein n=2 Tax=Niastella koreensis TaxID=354356 RepID=G8TQ13_NIAKG|nr:RagB/SusD family nutrient uptake outer membrane protein [Niastella koreensis]AEW01014.1 RagB/SusD domain-containing protein [Niastella koreensis GR20-10]OQP42622.1 hypothetical protein A4D02_13740 [Niastella koreensis]